MIKVGVITISDRGFRGEREDASGAVIRELVQEWGAQVELSTVVPDEIEKIAAVLIQAADDMKLDLIVTTGGTGVSPRDVTPEATRQVLEREFRVEKDPPRHDLPCRLRHPRPDPHRQPPRQPAGGTRRSGGDPACLASCHR